MIGYLSIDVTAYTRRKRVYRLNMDYTPERGQRLTDYLQANCIAGEACELWVVNTAARDTQAIRGELEHLHLNAIATGTVTPELLADVFGTVSENAQDYPRLVVIK